MSAIEKTLAKVTNRLDSQFVEWIPNRLLTTASEVNSSFMQHAFSGGLIANTTAVANPMRRIEEQFHKMFSRKAHLHHYLSEGMDEAEFLEAQSNIKDLIDEYVQYEQAGVDPEEEQSDGEDMEAECKPDARSDAHSAVSTTASVHQL